VILTDLCEANVKKWAVQQWKKAYQGVSASGNDSSIYMRPKTSRICYYNARFTLWTKWFSVSNQHKNSL